MKYKNYKFLIKNLLTKGYYSTKASEAISDVMADESVNIFNEVAKFDGLYLLNELFIHQRSPLSILGLSALLSSGTNEILSRDDIKITIFEILLNKKPDELLECVQFIKSDSFDRKLGSRAQKLFRKTMESWTNSELDEYINKYIDEIKQLVLLIHPRYINNRGIKIKELFANN